MPSSIQKLPESFESLRLLIRVPRPGDGIMLFEAINESHERLKAWFPWAQELTGLDERELFVRQCYCKYLLNEDMPLALFLKETGVLVGGSGLHYRDSHVPSFEIGYWLRSGYEGKGLMSEAVQAITCFAFEVAGANRVYIRCDMDNLRSQAVALRAGYVYEGRMRNSERKADSGDLTDMLFYGMTRSDYEKGNQK
ncbi:MAG: hypothetical protein BGO78_06340 [Chloroflexi bacterium 44-23]|nr:MAG: hypothetical protein BGO78_06340 [Chloroflexi bacterium 44-23]